MIQSMTAFANRTGGHGTTNWAWEMRGVNARGLDIRIRVPEGFDTVELAARKAVAESFQRGNITLNLRLNREDSASGFTLDSTQLDAVLSALDAVQERAFEMGVTLAQPNAADVLAQRGVMVQGRTDTDVAQIAAEARKDIAPLIAEFLEMRKSEGASLKAVITGQLSQIADLIKAAEAAADARRPQVQASLTAAMQRVLQDIAEVDDARVAQELAVLAVKADVTEEIDRLKTHVSAAHALIDDPKPGGRKLDFLAQEFNREANTLCSKAGASALTTVGLELKAVIDQMREQIQNVE